MFVFIQYPLTNNIEYKRRPYFVIVGILGALLVLQKISKLQNSLKKN